MGWRVLIYNYSVNHLKKVMIRAGPTSDPFHELYICYFDVTNNKWDSDKVKLSRKIQAYPICSAINVSSWKTGFGFLKKWNRNTQRETLSLICTLTYVESRPKGLLNIARLPIYVATVDTYLLPKVIKRKLKSTHVLQCTICLGFFSPFSCPIIHLKNKNDLVASTNVRFLTQGWLRLFLMIFASTVGSFFP